MEMNKERKAMRIAAVSCLSLLLTLNACHPISKSVSDKAEPNLSFSELREDPDQHIGKVVVLGGTVVRTEDRQAHSVLVVQQKRLGVTMEPRAGGPSGGRFLVVFPSLLDLDEYHRGRMITVGGQIEGAKRMSSGEQEDVYPVIRAMDSRLWETCGKGHYAYSFYKDYWGGTKSPYHKAHNYAHRCR
jgi:outer membrane lipoprotein